MMYRYKRFFRKITDNRNLRAKAACCLFAIAVVLLVVSGFLIKATTTKAAGNRVRTVASVKIEKNDSLWSIASEYYTDDFDSIQDMIDEIKQINGLTSDTIRTGNYIVVPYYMEPAKEVSLLSVE